MPATTGTSTVGLWLIAMTSVTGVFAATLQQEPGAVVAGMMGAIFYAIYGMASYTQWWHFFRALFAGATAAIIFGSFAASGLVYEVLTGSGLACATGLAGSLGARGLEWLGNAAEFIIRRPRE